MYRLILIQCNWRLPFCWWSDRNPWQTPIWWVPYRLCSGMALLPKRNRTPFRIFSHFFYQLSDNSGTHRILDEITSSMLIYWVILIETNLFPHSPCVSQKRNGFRTWNSLIGEYREVLCSTPPSVKKRTLRSPIYFAQVNGFFYTL